MKTAKPVAGKSMRLKSISRTIELIRQIKAAPEDSNNNMGRINRVDRIAQEQLILEAIRHVDATGNASAIHVSRRPYNADYSG